MQNNGFELRYLPLFYEELDHEVSYIAFILKNSRVAVRLIDDVEKAILKRLEDALIHLNLLRHIVKEKTYITGFMLETTLSTMLSWGKMEDE